MHQPSYPFHISNQAFRFDFLSVGKKIVSKSIINTQIEDSGVYSLALVDVQPDGATDDTSVTANGDMEKILLTVFQTFAVFFEKHPDSIIAFQGSTPSRTRLYQIAISQELNKVEKLYNIFGLIELGYESFQKITIILAFFLFRKRH